MGGPSQLIQEANTLQELIKIDESTIDPEYLEDFRALKVEAEQYLQTLAICWLYLLTESKPISVEDEKIYATWNSWSIWFLSFILIERALESVFAGWKTPVLNLFVVKSQCQLVSWRRGYKPVQPMGYAFISRFLYKNNMF